MLQDIAIEEFSHLEMVGKLIAHIRASWTKPPCTMPRCSSSSALSTFWIVREAAGRQPISRKAATSSATSGRIFQPKPPPTDLRVG